MQRNRLLPSSTSPPSLQTLPYLQPQLAVRNKPLNPDVWYYAAQVIRKESEDKGVLFNSRPYLRMFLGLLCELAPADTSDAIGLRYLKALGLALYNLQPACVPGEGRNRLRAWGLGLGVRIRLALSGLIPGMLARCGAQLPVGTIGWIGSKHADLRRTQ